MRLGLITTHPTSDLSWTSQCVLENLALLSVVVCSDATLSVGFSQWLPARKATEREESRRLAARLQIESELPWF